MEIWRGYVHPYTHTHTQSMRGFPVKTGTGSGNTHGDGFICHLYICHKKKLKCNQFNKKIVIKLRYFGFITLSKISLFCLKINVKCVKNKIFNRY